MKHYKDHMDMVHNDIKKVQCEICNKAISNVANLKIHMATHEKKYKCNSCDEEFSNEWFLKLHYNKTHAVKVRKCDLCDKEFPSQKNLDAHMNVHDNKYATVVVTKEERLAKIEQFSHAKASINKPEICLGCNRSCKLSSILHHLSRLPACRNKYSNVEFTTLNDRCKDYNKVRAQLQFKIKHQQRMLEQDKKLYHNAEEKSMAYKKRYLPLML